MTTEFQDRDRVIEDCVSGIVCGYVANNALPASELPALIASVRACLAGSSDRQPGGDAKTDHKVSEAQIRKSITPDALTSFIDGKPYKTLKRHLRTHGLDQHAYRERYGLPANYPMVAPSYSTLRRELSRNLRAKKSAGQAE